MKTLTQHIFSLNIIKTGREARLLIHSGRVSVNGSVITNEDCLISDSDKVTIAPKRNKTNG